VTGVEDLVVKAQRGDEAAFERLVVMHLPRAGATARMILGDATAADDVVQESMVQAWRALPRLREPDRFEAWLRRLVVNRCLNHRRSARRLDQAVGRLRPALTTPGPERDIVERDEIDRALRRLSPEQRTLLALRYGHDLSGVEIAGALGINPGAARSRLHAAVTALRAAMATEEERSRTDPVQEVT
jgi:RNA polymerase sigma-70 factor (ECF subfamily)